MFGRSLVTSAQALIVEERARTMTKLRLAVEVDGGAHEGRTHHDAQPDRELESLGWVVVRIPEALLFEQLEEAVRRILARAIRAR